MDEISDLKEVELRGISKNLATTSFNFHSISEIHLLLVPGYS